MTENPRPAHVPEVRYVESVRRCPAPDRDGDAQAADAHRLKQAEELIAEVLGDEGGANA